MPVLEDTLHTRWLSTLTVDSERLGVSASEIIEHLANFSIEARPVWKPIHMLADCDYFSEGQDNSKYLFDTGVCLSSDTKMTKEELNYVIEKIKDFCSSK